MPKQTFLNLSESKRQTIETAAIDEFASRGYEAASISQIVETAGIAKGSFYQYFEDKHDLFMHLVNLAAQEKRAFFKDKRAPSPNMNFFETLRWLFEAGYEYAASQSNLNQAVSRVLFGEGLFMGETFREMREASAQIFRDMIQQASDRGEIAQAIDPTVGAFIVETLLNSLGLFILNQQQVSKEDLSKGSMSWLYSEKSRQIIDHMLYVLENGLSSRQNSGLPEPEELSGDKT